MLVRQCDICNKVIHYADRVIRIKVARTGPAESEPVTEVPLDRWRDMDLCSACWEHITEVCRKNGKDSEV